MPRFPLTSEADATDEVAQIYHDFRKRMGFAEVPHFIQTQALSPAILNATWGLVENILITGKLPRATKELIFVAIATERECEYCQQAHAACCRMLGVNEQTIRSVQEGLQSGVPDFARNLLQFAIKCAKSPQELKDEDFETLRKEGMTSEQIFEVIAMASLALYATTIAEATMIEPDAMFEKM